MENTLKEYTYNDFESFVSAISYGGELYEIFNSGFIFRGESTDEYTLIPSALRDDTKELLYELGNYAGTDCMLRQMVNEFYILRRFYYTCDNENLYVPQCSIRKNRYLTSTMFLPMQLGFLKICMN